mgnify:CR=1 FL=1
MLLIDTFVLALKNIWSNKMRTILTMLGIIIGVTAVIVIVGLGNGMTQQVRESFSSMGINSMSVSIWGRGSSRTATVDYMYQVVDDNPQYLSDISPNVQVSNQTVKEGRDTYRYTGVYGVNEDYTAMANYTIAEGRGLQYMDMKENKYVCVIGDYLAREAYNGNAVGETIKVGAYQFRIVGTLSPKTSDPELQEGGEDDRVYIPYTVALRINQSTMVDSYTVIMADENYASQAKSTIEQALYAIYQNEDSYYVYSMSELLEQMNQTISMVVMVLTLIAGISLLVGGIGIMNIMLVSVSERTREIGIRKALGARETTILFQFVVEAGTTSALGGFIGIVLGYGLSAAATAVVPLVAPGQSVAISPGTTAVLVSFGISVGIGVVFGFLPARRAARLNPIEALRYE